MSEQKDLLPFSDGGIDRLAKFFEDVEGYTRGLELSPSLLMLSAKHKAQLLSDCIVAARKHVENVKAIEGIIGK
jgi:hypothetical protein